MIDASSPFRTYLYKYMYARMHVCVFAVLSNARVAIAESSVSASCKPKHHQDIPIRQHSQQMKHLRVNLLRRKIYPCPLAVKLPHPFQGGMRTATAFSSLLGAETFPGGVLEVSVFCFRVAPRMTARGQQALMTLCTLLPTVKAEVLEFSSHTVTQLETATRCPSLVLACSFVTQTFERWVFGWPVSPPSETRKHPQQPVLGWSLVVISSSA